jgi:transposase
MARKLDSMDLKQIITLHLDGISNRKIASTLGISRNTVNHYLKLFSAGKYDLKELLSFDNNRLDSLFPSLTTIDNKRYQELCEYLKGINSFRNHPGFTFLNHYQEYCQTYSNPYSYTQFIEHYKRKYSKIKGSMKLEHKPGYEMFIDFAGKKLEMVDRTTGLVRKVEVFVAILPFSQYTYVQAIPSQKREDLIQCCIDALTFFGGAPKAIVSDNLKSAVNRSSRYEADINRSFKDLARHYNCVINPTRTYAPQDKALVENAVNLIYQRIYYPLRNMTFFSLKDLNAEIKSLLQIHNDLLFKLKEASRKELFQSIESEHLKALPQQPYQIKGYRRAKVQKIGYVYFSPDKSYYSVPFRFIGKETLIHYTPSSIEVYFYHERIACHKRNNTKGSYNTNKDHLSSTHKYYSDWSPDFFLKKAAPLGKNVYNCVQQMMTNVDYPEIGYKRVMGLLQLRKSFGAERLNEACKIALMADAVSYMRIKNILQNNHDKNPILFDELDQTKSHIPKHKNIRGANNYK